MKQKRAPESAPFNEIVQVLNFSEFLNKINDLVSKFCGAYEAATRERSSDQNENDVLKLAHEILFNNHNKKFTLEHDWKDLCNDQKWCDMSS